MIGWFVLGILFLLSGIMYISIEIAYIVRTRKLKIISLTRLIYSLTFGFVASLLCFLYVWNHQKLHLSTLVIMEYDATALENLYLFWFFSVIGYISMNIAYNLLAEKKVRLGKQTDHRIEYDLTERQILVIALVALFIGAFSLHMWTKDLGGVFEFIPLASAIRGDYLNTYGNTHIAWRQPAKIILPAAFLFYFLAISKDTKNKLLARLLCIISMFVAVLYLVCNDGRLTIALFFTMLILGFFHHGSVKIKNPRKLISGLILVAILAGILLANLNDITYFIRHQKFRPADVSSESSVILQLMNEFLFVYKSGITSIQTTLWEGGPLQVVNDFILGITAYLPARFSPTGFMLVSRYNTALCTGTNSSTIGSIPADMISLSVYDLGWLGPIIIPFVLGAVISLVEGHFKGTRRDAYHLAMYYGLMMAFFRVVNYCELTDIALSLFPYLVIYVTAHMVPIVFGKWRRTKKTVLRF